MFAIQTKYHGPTHTRGARISVRERQLNGSITRKYYDYDHGARDAHEVAIVEYLKQRDIIGDGKWAYACTDNVEGNGLVAMVYAAQSFCTSCVFACTLVD